MFDTLDGLPLHALVIHAAVVLIPLSGLLGVLYALPRTRAWARWPLAVVSVAALGSTFVATRSGEALERVRQYDGANSEAPQAALIERHSELGTQLLYLVLAFTVVAVAAAVLTCRTHAPSAAESAGESAAASPGRQPVAIGLSVLLVVGAALVGTWTYRVGDLGARAVWDPTDSVDYSDPGT